MVRRPCNVWPVILPSKFRLIRYSVRVNNTARIISALLLSFIAVQAADLRGARLFKSGPIQITADGTRVWCVNPDNDSVTRVETATRIATEFPLPSIPAKHSPRGLSVKE